MVVPRTVLIKIKLICVVCTFEGNIKIWLILDHARMSLSSRFIRTQKNECKYLLSTCLKIPTDRFGTQLKYQFCQKILHWTWKETFYFWWSVPDGKQFWSVLYFWNSKKLFSIDCYYQYWNGKRTIFGKLLSLISVNLFKFQPKLC